MLRLLTRDSVYGAQSLVAVFDTEIAKLSGIDLEAIASCDSMPRSTWQISTAKRATARAKLENMEKLAADLTGQVDVLTEGGTPAERLAAVQRRARGAAARRGERPGA